MKGLPEKADGLILICFYALMYFAIPVSYLYALWSDIKHDNFAMFAADLILIPMGIVHGLILLIWG